MKLMTTSQARVGFAQFVLLVAEVRRAARHERALQAAR